MQVELGLVSIEQLDEAVTQQLRKSTHPVMLIKVIIQTLSETKIARTV
jgi:hypothetical protein